jgi:hypothetical protein
VAYGCEVDLVVVSVGNKVGNETGCGRRKGV